MPLSTVGRRPPQSTSSACVARTRLGFATQEEALAYAAKNGIDAEVIATPERKLKIQAYADNFR